MVQHLGKYQAGESQVPKLCQRQNYKDMAVAIIEKLNGSLSNLGYSPTTTTATTTENTDQYNHLLQYPSSGRIH